MSRGRVKVLYELEFCAGRCLGAGTKGMGYKWCEKVQRLRCKIWDAISQLT